MDCSLPGSSVHGIFQARVLEWGVIAFSQITATMYQIFISQKLSNIMSFLLKCYINVFCTDPVTEFYYKRVHTKDREIDE